MKVNKTWKKTSGIYKISFKDVCYVGSSKDLYSRLAQHISHLRNNKHHSRYMQRCFNKHSENDFFIEILEVIEYDEKKLRNLELFYIKSNNSKFNSTTPIEYRHSKEMKEKISKTLKEKYKTGQIIPPKLNKGNKISIYNFEGNLLHKNIFIKEAIKILNLSNRGVLNTNIRLGRAVCKKQFIIIPENKDFTFLYDWIIKNKGSDIPIYKINEFGMITKCTYSSKIRVVNKVLKANDFLYFSKQNKCYYTFIGNLNKCRYYKKL